MNIKNFFKRKTVSELKKEAESSSELKRSFSAFQLILLGIGAIIGAGIFVLTGTAASQAAGPAVVLSFILSGIACMCAGLCYAELSSMIPVSGSAYTYIYATLGEIVAWIVVSLVIVGTVLIISSVASGWSGYAMSFLEDLGMHIPGKYTALISLFGDRKFGIEVDFFAFFIVIVMTSILYFGAQASNLINAIIVFIKMSVLIAFIVLGATKIDTQNWVPFIPENTGEFGKFGWSGIVSGAALVFLAYNGFDTVATAAQEAKNPQRDLPIGILGALTVCSITYILVALVLTGLVDYRELNVAQPIAIAVNKMNMPWFAKIVKIGAIAGLSSVILSMMYGLVRVIFVVTKDGLLPSILAKSHVVYKTPHVATIIMGLLISFMASVVPLEHMVKLANFCIISVFSVVCFGCIYLRYKQPEVKRVFRCPFMPWTPLFGVVLFIQILIGLPIEVYLQALGLVIVAIIYYMIYGYRHSILQKKHCTEVEKS